MALVGFYLGAKFGDTRSKLGVSEIESIRLKNKIAPCGHNFDPS